MVKTIHRWNLQKKGNVLTCGRLYKKGMEVVPYRPSLKLLLAEQPDLKPCKVCFPEFR